VDFVRCPVCDELIDLSMALVSGGSTHLLCWNGHRFGLDGALVAADAEPSGTPTAISCSGASFLDGATG
jgi:hypothetical protein